jgi:hypothetical protein
MTTAYNPFQSTMDVLDKIDADIRARVSADSVNITRQELVEHYTTLQKELDYSSTLWWLMDLQDFGVATESYERTYRKIFEIKKLIKTVNAKISD